MDRSRVIVVEEHATVRAALVRHLADLGTGAAHVGVLDHESALASTALDDVGVALVSAVRHPRAQDRDPTVPLLAGPDVVAHLRRAGFVGPAIVYGTRASWPEVTITARQAGATAVATEHAVLRSPGLAHGHGIEAALPAPTGDDFRSLGLEPDARVWEAIVAMRHVRHRDRFPHGDAWERVAQTDPSRKIDDRTREYINDRVGPLLGITTGHARHRRITALIARIVGLPAPRSMGDGDAAAAVVPAVGPGRRLA